MKTIALALPLVLVVSACGSEPEPVETPTPTPTVNAPRTLLAAGFDAEELGPRIVGPDGDEVTSEVTFDGQTIATVVSYVACPRPETDDDSEDAEGPAAPPEASGEKARCNPDEQADGAVYTYVHRVTPAEGAESPVMSFRTSRRVTGFANAIGFDRDQAQAALGEGYNIRVSIDNGSLIWRIESGDGWTAGEEITFFWRGSLPPEGPADAYEIETEAGRSRATGPFPPARMPEEEEEAETAE